MAARDVSLDVVAAHCSEATVLDGAPVGEVRLLAEMVEQVEESVPNVFPFDRHVAERAVEESLLLVPEKNAIGAW